jgi:glycosyltransferase involved in cell wall biosynthesis
MTRAAIKFLPARIVVERINIHQLKNTLLLILIVMNGWRDKVSRGGDYHMLRVLKIWGKNHQISLIMPKLGYEFTVSMLSEKAPIYISSYESEELRDLRAVVKAYVLRSVKSLFVKVKKYPDIIISSSHLFYDVFPAIFLNKHYNNKSKVVVYIFHLFSSSRSYTEGVWNILSLLSERISLFLCKKADLIFVDNNIIKIALVNKGFTDEKIFVTRNGIEYNFISSVKQGDKKFDGCFCGVLDKRKGVYDLLDIWQKVITRFPAAELVVIGQGPESARLTKEIKNKKLQTNITLAGYLPEDQKILIMKSSKTFIFPSYEEGWGIALSEAMACGLPAVCYRLAAYDVFGDGIVKVDVGNKETMADAVIDLLSNQAKQKNLGDRAKEATRSLDWDDIAAEEFREISKLGLNE